MQSPEDRKEREELGGLFGVRETFYLEQHADVFFEVEGQLIKGNKAVLAQRSQYFKAMFTRFGEKQTDYVPMPDVQLIFFNAVLQ